MPRKRQGEVKSVDEDVIAEQGGVTIGSIEMCLRDVTKASPSADEERADWLRRLATKANDGSVVSDDAFENLPEDAQVWVVDANEAIQHRKPVEEPGLVASGAEGQQGQEDETDSSDEPDAPDDSDEPDAPDDSDEPEEEIAKVEPDKEEGIKAENRTGCTESTEGTEGSKRKERKASAVVNEKSSVEDYARVDCGFGFVEIRYID